MNHDICVRPVGRVASPTLHWRRSSISIGWSIIVTIIPFHHVPITILIDHLVADGDWLIKVGAQFLKSHLIVCQAIFISLNGLTFCSLFCDRLIGKVF